MESSAFEKILVSVIVPVYRTEKYLSKCMDSLLQQTHFEIEIILVDDGSPDNSPMLCNAYANEDQRVRVIHQKNSGACMSRQTGLNESNGEYVLFVDSDDWIELDMIEQCLKVAVNNNSDCVMCGYVREYPERSILTSLFEQEFTYDKEQSEKLIHRRIVGLTEKELRNPQCIDNLSSFCMKLYRREIAQKGLVISERIIGTSEDTIFNLYALEDCKISYINKCFYHYRKENAQSITTAYKPDLSEKWDIMYEKIKDYIEKSGKCEEYRVPFMNRVACGMIGLGLNEISSRDGFAAKTKRIRKIIHKPLYMEAFQQLDISFCDFKWKLFFILCKNKAAVLLTSLLIVMNYLRSRINA